LKRGYRKRVCVPFVSSHKKKQKTAFRRESKGGEEEK
jgi:hypothetical protein